MSSNWAMGACSSGQGTLFVGLVSWLPCGSKPTPAGDATWAAAYASPLGPAPVVVYVGLAACDCVWWAFRGPAGTAPPIAQCGPTTTPARATRSSSFSSAWAMLLASWIEAMHVAYRPPGRAASCACSSFRWAPVSSLTASMDMQSSARSTSTTVDGTADGAGSSTARRVLSTCGSGTGSD